MPLMYATLKGLSIGDDEFISYAFKVACKQSGAEIKGRKDCHFVPQGYSAVMLIAESHAAIHTWPEHGYAKVVFYTCAKDGEQQIEKFCSVWKAFGFKVEQKNVVEI